MLNALSKAIILYLAPLLALTSLLLSAFAYLAPSLLLNDRVALVTVLPSTELVQTGPAQSVDGPSLFIGLLGGCGRRSQGDKVNCTIASISPLYDLTVLPAKAPQLMLSSPPSGAPAFVAVGISLSFIFFLSFTLISFRHKLGTGLSGLLDKPMVQRVSAWVGFLGFFIGLTTFLVVRMWFGKAVDDFNRSIQFMGSAAPKLAASNGNAFTMVWVAYSFMAVPVIASLTKLNFSVSGGGKA